MDQPTTATAEALRGLAPRIFLQLHEHTAALPFFDPQIVSPELRVGDNRAPTDAISDLLGLESRDWTKTRGLRWAYAGMTGGVCGLQLDLFTERFQATYVFGSDWRIGDPPDPEHVYNYYVAFGVNRWGMDVPVVGRSVSREIPGGRQLGEEDGPLPYLGTPADIFHLATTRLRPNAHPRVFLENDEFSGHIRCHPTATDRNMARISGWLDADEARQRAVAEQLHRADRLRPTRQPGAEGPAPISGSTPSAPPITDSSGESPPPARPSGHGRSGPGSPGL